MENTGENLAKIYKELSDLEHDFRNFNLINLIISKVQGEKVLEIGCGNSILLKKLKEKGKKVVGIEPNEEIIKIAKNLNSEIKVIHGSAENLGNLVTEKFDAIIMSDVLEHIENDELLLENLHKYFNKAGELIIVVPAYQSLYGIRDKNIGHYRRYSKRTLKKLLKSKDYHISEIFYWNMLGVLPYFLYEKIWHKPIHTELRSGKKMNFFKRFVSKLLFMWFKYIENHINFGFGLSLVCVAKINGYNQNYDGKR